MKETIMKVKGMMCGGCENRVKNVLGGIEGVQSVEADHTTGIVKIVSQKEIDRNIITEKIDDLGYEVVKEDEL